MNFKFGLLGFLLTFILVACNSDDEMIYCFTSPQPVTLELVDEAGGNLIENGTLTFGNLKVKEVLGEDQYKNIPIQLLENNRVMVQEVGWFDGIKTYIFESPIQHFSFSVQSHEIVDSHCGGFIVDAVNFDGVMVDDSHYGTEGYFVVTLVGAE